MVHAINLVVNIFLLSSYITPVFDPEQKRIILVPDERSGVGQGPGRARVAVGDCVSVGVAVGVPV